MSATTSVPTSPVRPQSQTPGASTSRRPTMSSEVPPLPIAMWSPATRTTASTSTHRPPPATSSRATTSAPTPPGPQPSPTVTTAFMSGMERPATPSVARLPAPATSFPATSATASSSPVLVPIPTPWLATTSVPTRREPPQFQTQPPASNSTAPTATRSEERLEAPATSSRATRVWGSGSLGVRAPTSSRATSSDSTHWRRPPCRNARGITINSGAVGNTIGGTSGGAGNVLSGNSSEGILFSNATTTGNVVQGNYIGANSSGAAALETCRGVSRSSAAPSAISSAVTAQVKGTSSPTTTTA